MGEQRKSKRDVTRALEDLNASASTAYTLVLGDHGYLLKDPGGYTIPDEPIVGAAQMVAALSLASAVAFDLRFRHSIGTHVR